MKLLLSSSGEEILKRTRRNDVRVRVGGQSAYRRIRKLIRRTTANIVVQVFIWKDDRTGRKIAELLVRAARRGVEIHIMKDSLGDAFELNESFIGTKESLSPLWQEFWNHANIHIDTSSKADHSKTWVFDGRIVLLSGMNIGEEYEHAWHDFLLELHGSMYVHAVLQRTMLTSNDHSDAKIIVNNTRASGIRPCAMTLIAQAKRRIVVEHCYLSDKTILSALAAASQRSVHVTILSPKNPDVQHRANLAALASLTGRSHPTYMHILQYPRMFHSKVLLVDSAYCLAGSANFNTLSLDRTGEVCVLLSSESKALKKIKRRLRIDVLQSKIFSVPKSTLLTRILGRFGL